MTIAEYQNLTGTTVPESDTARMKAVIRRSETRLETLLGYSLSKQKTWTEKGKAQYDGYTPFPFLPLGSTTLLDADEPTGDIQLFHFDTLNMHLRINPAKEIYKVSLVLPVNEDEFVTVYELGNITPYLNSAGLVTAVTRYSTWFTWPWWNSLLWTDRKNLMLAVDGDFVNVCDANKYPDLAYLLADMVTYYSDPNYSVMGNITSESIDTHSYTRAATGGRDTAPEAQPTSKRIIEKYAGPAAFRKLVT